MGVEAKCKVCKAEERKPGIHAERKRKADLHARGLRQCSVCRSIKPISEFHTRRASQDGLAYKCAECIKAYCREWKSKNPNAWAEWYSIPENAGSSKERARLRRERVGRDELARQFAAWARANKAKVNALIAKRTAAKKRALPSWADLDAIRAFYERAVWLTETTGIKHEVDHIYPLQGKTVCGLHCEANLQILTEFDNISKGNLMPEDWNGRYAPTRHRLDDDGNRACHP